MRPDHVEDGKEEKMNSNSIGGPGRVPTSLLEKRGRDENNYRYRDPEHVKENAEGEN